MLMLKIQNEKSKTNRQCTFFQFFILAKVISLALAHELTNHFLILEQNQNSGSQNANTEA